jgi:L-seryl-tRNA(Ser) seleniumtransferase
MTALYSLLPPLTKIRNLCQEEERFCALPDTLLTTFIQEALEEVRQQIKVGKWTEEALKTVDWKHYVSHYTQRQLQRKIVRVLNGTGVILHTGLGRAVLSESSLNAIQEEAQGYTLVEVDRESGERNEREDYLKGLLQRITGAESALLVNNNAAATVLVLNEIAKGKEVIVSRGQLVEIGGSFRIPEIMECSGALLKEVGSTNKTHLRDYEKAIHPSTALLMKIHTSNFRIVGFSQNVSLPELVELGKKHQLPVADDLGAGALIDFTSFGLDYEPRVQDSIQAGADLVLFSGDKLVGACQAGIIVGKASWIKRLRKNPLYRAFRVDKLTLLTLENTLRYFLDPHWAVQHIPCLKMMNEKKETLFQRGLELQKALPPLSCPFFQVELLDGFSAIGSGSLPTAQLPTTLLALIPQSLSAQALAKKLRENSPCIFSRVQDNKVLLDLRTLRPQEDPLLLKALLQLHHPPSEKEFKSEKF